MLCVRPPRGGLTGKRTDRSAGGVGVFAMVLEVAVFLHDVLVEELLGRRRGVGL